MNRCLEEISCLHNDQQSVQGVQEASTATNSVPESISEVVDEVSVSEEKTKLAQPSPEAVNENSQESIPEAVFESSSEEWLKK